MFYVTEKLTTIIIRTANDFARDQPNSVCNVKRYFFITDSLGAQPCSESPNRRLPLQFIYFHWCCGPTRGMASSFLRFLDHTQRRTTVCRTPLDKWCSPLQGPLPDNTQHSQQTDIHSTVGIRTHNFSRPAAGDLCLRKCGHWDRPLYYSFPPLTYKILLSFPFPLRLT